jgi:hypothetical protein
MDDEYRRSADGQGVAEPRQSIVFTADAIVSNHEAAWLADLSAIVLDAPTSRAERESPSVQRGGSGSGAGGESLAEAFEWLRQIASAAPLRSCIFVQS